jgi:hypothetical protein
MSVSPLDRVYWYLALYGPSTVEIVADYFQWSTHYTSDVLFRLRIKGCVRLIEPKQYRSRHGKKCGKWQAVTTDGQPDSL